jgi:hypothetical protein
MGFYLGEWQSLWLYSVLFTLSFFAFYTLYDIGYIYNDIFTIKYEENPNFRLKKEAYSYFEKHYEQIVSKKILLFMVLLSIAMAFSFCYELSVYFGAYLMMVCGVGVAFTLHNRVRSRWNIGTFFLLSSLKYITPLMLLLPWSQMVLIWPYVILLFPLPRTIEHATKTKYHLQSWQRLIGSHDRFRLYYYALLWVVLSIMDVGMVVEGVALYFFFYRFVLYILLKSSLLLRPKES